jgi:hypothetical protein
LVTTTGRVREESRDLMVGRVAEFLTCDGVIADVAIGVATAVAAVETMETVETGIAWGGTPVTSAAEMTRTATSALVGRLRHLIVNSPCRHHGAASNPHFERVRYERRLGSRLIRLLHVHLVSQG